MADTNARLNVLVALKSVIQDGDAALEWITKYGAALATAAATMAVFAGKQGIDLGSAITDLANRAQMGTDAFQVLSLTALDSGVSMEEVSASAAKYRQNIQTAREGNTAMIASLAQLNLTAAGLQALAPERQWEVFAQRIATATDRQAALNAAADLFGAKNAPKLMEVLQRLGVEGYDKLAQGTDKIRISSEQLQTLDDAGDKLGRIVEHLKYIAAKGTAGVLSGAVVGGTLDLVEQSFNDNEIKRAEALIEVWTKKGNDAMVATWRANLAALKAAALADPYAERNAMRAPKRAEATAAAQENAMAEANAAAFAKERAADWEKIQAAAELTTRQELVAQINKASERNADERAAQKRFAVFEAEQVLSRQLAASQATISQLLADSLLGRQEREQLITAELKKQNDEIARRIALLEAQQALTPDVARQGQIDSLRGNVVQNDAQIEAMRPRGVGESVQGALVSQMDQVGTAAENAASIVSGTLGGAVDGISGSMQGLINGTMTWGDALRNIGSTIMQSVVAAIADMFAKWIVGRAAAAMAGMAWSAKEGAADTAAKTPGALLTSISSFGVAAAVGLAALVGVMALAGGFADGGKVTGPGNGTSDSIPAWLSDGEYVLPAGVAAAIGYDTLDAVRSGRSPLATTAAAAGGGGGSTGRAAGGRGAAITVVTGGTRSEVRRQMESAEGQAHFLDISQRNRLNLGIPG